MWTRARIKQEAKNSLRRFGYWMPLLVTFLTGLVSGGMVTGNTSTSSITTEYTSEYSGDLTPAGFAAFMDEFFGEFFGEIGAAFENFFSNPLIAMTTIFVIVPHHHNSQILRSAYRFTPRRIQPISRRIYPN